MKNKIFSSLLFLLFATSCSQNEKTNPVRKDITDAVFASGNIFNKNEYNITASTDEYLIRSFVNEGDKVHQGMQMFLLSSEVTNAQFETAQADYLDAKAKNNDNSPRIQELMIQIKQANNQLDADEKNYKRYENLVKTNAVSQTDYEKARLQYENSRNNKAVIEQSLLDLKRELQLNETNTAAQLRIQTRNQKDYYISADFEGIVMSVNKKQGDYVRRGETIAKLGDGNPLIKLLIAEEDIKLVRLDNKVVVSLNTDKGKTYNARISKIYPAFNDKEQSFIAEATFENIPEDLYYDTQLQANIIVAEKTNALIVPAKYIINGNSLELDNGKTVQIVKGISNNEWVEVLDGTTEKETIVFHNSKK